MNTVTLTRKSDPAIRYAIPVMEGEDPRDRALEFLGYDLSYEPVEWDWGSNPFLVKVVAEGEVKAVENLLTFQDYTVEAPS